jgi:cytochrome c-type biogenesis protein CcmE
MAELAWEKSPRPNVEILKQQNANQRSERLKFLVGGLLLLGAIGYLLISGTLLGQRFFITVEEMLTLPKYAGQTVRITGAVVGDTIQETTTEDGTYIITFAIANIPTETDNLAEALNLAANDPNALTLPIRVENQPRPELLQHESQAILTGKLDANGVFHATELQFKCPSRFEEAAPDLRGSESDHPGMQAG